MIIVVAIYSTNIFVGNAFCDFFTRDILWVVVAFTITYMSQKSSYYNKSKKRFKSKIWLKNIEY